MAAQTLRVERMGERLWPNERLGVAEVTRRLALTQLLWAQSEPGWSDVPQPEAVNQPQN